MQTAHFRKLPDGSWGIRVLGPVPEFGDSIIVSKRNNETSTVRVTEVLEPVEGGFLCRFVDGAPDAPAPAARTPREYIPTAEQNHALELVLTGADVAIEAGAGAGKTSSLILIGEALERLGKRGQYIAFNKSIVRDSAGKFPRSVACDTAHSLAFRAVGKPYGPRMDGGSRMKSSELAALLGIDPIKVTKWNDEPKRLGAAFLAGHVMKSIVRFCQTADETISARHVPLIDGLDAPPSPLHPASYTVNNQVARALEPYLRSAWQDLLMYRGKLPMTKSTGLAVILKLWQLSSPRINADYILFDEAQDASPVMIDVIAQQTHAQRIWVGDSNQQIYEFTGAVNALASVATDRRAMLTQSFRFGPAIADVANEVLALLPTEMRIVGTTEIGSRVQAAALPDAILTRTNATAIRAVITALANDQHPCLIGGAGEVASFCRAALELMTFGTTDHPELACFSSWGEVQEYVENDAQGDDLLLMVRLIDEFGVEKILEAIDGCAREEDADLVVSTAHKAKGREWMSVKLGSDFPERDKMGAEELRLLYVAITRARRELDVTAVPFFNEQEPTGAPAPTQEGVPS